jgi:hypothetical protein
MPKYNLKRVDLYCPQYQTDATIRVDENHSSGRPHLVVEYADDQRSGHKGFATAIPASWTDEDLAALIFEPKKPPSGRNWPSWEVPANDGASFELYRWWKGEKPP